MEAVRFHGYGDVGMLRYEDVERPRPGPGEVLVQVAATRNGLTTTLRLRGKAIFFEHD